MKGTVPFLKVCDNKRKGLQREDTSMVTAKMYNVTEVCKHN